MSSLVVPARIPSTVTCAPETLETTFKRVFLGGATPAIDRWAFGAVAGEEGLASEGERRDFALIP